jgi:diguanylate cyclase (GGDEF)-like protein
MDQYTLFVLLSPFGAVISIVLASFGWEHRKIRGARSVAYTMGLVAVYLILNTLELVDPTPQGTLFFAQACYISIGILAVEWFSFGLYFSNKEHLLASPFTRLLWVIPFITIGLVFTNSYHHLIWRDYTFVTVANGFLHMRVTAYGSWFWVFWFQAYVLILSGAILMVWTCFAPGKYYRIQSYLAVLAALLPLSVNLIYVLRLIPGLYKDYSPLGYALGGALLAISIFRYRLLDLTPLGRSILIDNMTDGMLTLDPVYRVVDYNPASAMIFKSAGLSAPQIGEPVEVLDPFLKDFETKPDQSLLQTEMTLERDAENEYYDLQIRRVTNWQDTEVLGYLVVLHSVTEHKKLFQAARKLSEEDPLTGVLNRNRFTELANQAIEHLRTPAKCSILMIDVDHFKGYNDTKGHICGDQLLQAFVRELTKLLRSTDLVGRIGGDEFIILLPETGLSGAQDLAERLCQQIATTPLETEDYGSFPISISVGVCEYDGRNSNTLESVILAADKGLYQAKALGRNRVCVYQS